MGKFKEKIVILLALCFVLSMTATAVSAKDGGYGGYNHGYGDYGHHGYDHDYDHYYHHDYHHYYHYDYHHYYHGWPYHDYDDY